MQPIFMRFVLPNFAYGFSGQISAGRSGDRSSTAAPRLLPVLGGGLRSLYFP